VSHVPVAEPVDYNPPPKKTFSAIVGVICVCAIRVSVAAVGISVITGAKGTYCQSGTDAETGPATKAPTKTAPGKPTAMKASTAMESAKAPRIGLCRQGNGASNRSCGKSRNSDSP
jgi:hypothetical protein